ncbi:hypothetical protein XELAEV_18038977mg [Xenopus laevis]|uniref:Uncharacterized protein n=1 Tax=Xenopus laevis TaxID=8355 RepID=A0A974C6Z0_XENLA|nr:hypothetical protein XELAEV_18038977mg [Xenopus laevis]
MLILFFINNITLNMRIHCTVIEIHLTTVYEIKYNVSEKMGVNNAQYSLLLLRRLFQSPQKTNQITNDIQIHTTKLQPEYTSNTRKRIPLPEKEKVMGLLDIF